MSEAAEATAPAAAEVAAPANDNAAPAEVAEPVDYGGADLAAAMEEGAAEGGEASAAEYLDIDNLGDLGSKMVRMKVNGEVITVPMAEALKGSQRMKAATKKEMAAAAKVKQAEAELQAFLDDPAAFAAKGGDTAVEKAILQWINSPDPAVQGAVDRAMQRVLQDSQMTPEQKAQAEREREFQQREAKVKEWEEQQKQQQHSAAVEKQRANLTAEFTKAFEERGINPTPYAIARAALAMQAQNENGMDVDAAQAVDLAAEELNQGFTSQLSGLEGTALLERLGPDITKAVSKALIAQVRGQRPGRTARATPKPAANDNAEETPVTTEELRRQFGSGHSVF